MKLKELQNKLKNNEISSVYTIKGNEYSLNKKTHDLFKSLMSSEDLDMNFISFDLKENSIEDVVNEAVSAPFFGEYRLIFVENPSFLTGEKNNMEQNIDLLIQYINNPVSTTILVIFATYEKLDSRKKIVKELNKLTTIVDNSKINDNQVENYIISLINNNGYQIDSDALDLLMRKTKNNFSEIEINLEKLFLYSIDTKQISINSVNLLVPDTLDDNVFDFVNSVLDKDTSSAEIRYNQLLIQKVDPIALNGLVISQLRLIIQINIFLKKGITQDTIAKNLKVHPYRVKMMTSKAKSYSLSLLKEMYNYLIEMDYQMKTGYSDKEMLFSLFIAKFA